MNRNVLQLVTYTHTRHIHFANKNTYGLTILSDCGRLCVLWCVWSWTSHTTLTTIWTGRSTCTFAVIGGLFASSISAVADGVAARDLPWAVRCNVMFSAVLSFRLRYFFSSLFISFVSGYDDCGYALFYCVYFVFVGVFHSHLLHILRSFSGVLAGFTHFAACYSADSWDLFFFCCCKDQAKTTCFGLWFRIESNVHCNKMWIIGISGIEHFLAVRGALENFIFRFNINLGMRYELWRINVSFLSDFI